MLKNLSRGVPIASPSRRSVGLELGRSRQSKEVEMKSHRTTTGALAVLFLIVFAAIAFGAERATVKLAVPGDKDNNYRVTILVSNEEDEAPVIDPKLVNAWGIAASDTGPWWVADNETGFSTIYNGDGDKLPLEVQVPGAPTGIVHNGGSQFLPAPN